MNRNIFEAFKRGGAEFAGPRQAPDLKQLGKTFLLDSNALSVE